MSRYFRTRDVCIFPLSAALCIVALAGNAFAHGKDVHDHGDHEHEAAPKGGPTPLPPGKGASFTVWDARYEIFAEHRVPVAGTITRFATHVTDRKTGLPLDGPGVHLGLKKDGEESFEAGGGGPASPGIYLIEATAPKPGVWKLYAHLHDRNDEYTIALPDLTVYATQAEADASPEKEEAEGIAFRKEQQWKIRLMTQPAGKRMLTGRMRVAATVKPVPGGKVEIAAPAAGLLAAPESGALPQAGMRVEAGQILAMLKPAPGGARIALASAQNQTEAAAIEIEAKAAEARANAAAAKAALAQAERNLARVRTLAQSKAKSAREVEEAETATAAARAALDAAERTAAAYASARFERGGKAMAAGDAALTFPILSPVAGTIGMFSGNTGGVVTADAPLFTIYNLDRVQIEARVPEFKLGRLGEAPEAHYLAGVDNTPHAILAEGGQLLYMAQEVDPRTRTASLLYEIKNTAGLRLGAALPLELETQRVPDAIAVPANALVDESGRYAVFVQVSGESFDKRIATLGVRDGDWVEIKDGVREGEMVVTDGAYAVRVASVSNAIPAHGHAH